MCRLYNDTKTVYIICMFVYICMHVDPGVEKYTLSLGNITPVTLREWSARGITMILYVFIYFVSSFLM